MEQKNEITNKVANSQEETSKEIRLTLKAILIVVCVMVLTQDMSLFHTIILKVPALYLAWLVVRKPVKKMLAKSKNITDSSERFVKSLCLRAKARILSQRIKPFLQKGKTSNEKISTTTKIETALKVLIALACSLVILGVPIEGILLWQTIAFKGIAFLLLFLTIKISMPKKKAQVEKNSDKEKPIEKNQLEKAIVADKTSLTTTRQVYETSHHSKYFDKVTFEIKK